METLSKLKISRDYTGAKELLPIKVLQFGEGNFLRAFVDYSFFKLNKELNFNAGIAVVQPLENGMVHMIEEQEGLFTLFLNGIKNGQKIQDIYLIDNIVKCINPYKEFQEFLDLAKLDSLEFVVSNTTEAGIEYLETDTMDMKPPIAFPARLALFLYHRYKHFKGDLDKGLAIIPCELINNNADTLKKIIMDYGKLWKLELDFNNWINNSCTFHNTLVDRIVPGYPKNEIEDYNDKLDYHDDILVTAEPFFLWVIEGDDALKEKLPFHKTDLNVKIVKDMQPFRTLKVRILNGVHTAMVPLSILYGNKTVRETLEDEFTGNFINKILFNEINDSLEMDSEEILSYSEEVLDRFRNPFIKHLLSDIALNSVSKFKVRVLPSIKQFYKKNNALPFNLVFGLASLIRFYKGDWNGEKLPVNDSTDITELFTEIWKKSSLEDVVSAVLANDHFWGENLSEVVGLHSATYSALKEIEENGVVEGYKNYINQFS